jgi:hypothetical protein
MAEPGGGQGGQGAPAAEALDAWVWWPEAAEAAGDRWEPEQPAATPRTLQERGQPPTPEEVGRAAAWCVRTTEPDTVIARRLGIGRRTLARWKQRPEYRAAVAALQAWREAERDEGDAASGRATNAGARNDQAS